LGIETQRQWSDLAIDRSTPLLFGLYSLVALGWRTRFIPMDAFLSRKQPGITNTHPPFMMSWLRFGCASGGTALFPQHPLTLMWF
jgi:hypothetical protein